MSSTADNHPTGNHHPAPSSRKGSVVTNGKTEQKPVAPPAGDRMLKPLGYVGFDSLPEQLVQRVIRNGFVFNLMTVGATGVGKSTLVDSLFNMKFPDVTTRSHTLSTVDVSVQSFEMIEKNIKLKLGLVETRGFGDQMNKAESSEAIVKYIDGQFEKYLQEELKIHRSNNLQLQDTRIHACLYLISPNGHGLRAIDLVTMQTLDKKVNLIPVIAKADTITKLELDKFRARVMSEIITNGINIYHFPTDDPEVADINSSNNGILPFAVVASHDLVRVGNKQVRARQYPWGTVQIENEQHSDFVRLREMLLRVNMDDLREKTHQLHYENYRRMRLEQMGFGADSTDTGVPRQTSFQETIDAKRERHYQEMKRKEEEMRQMFVIKVKEKEAELKEQEKEIHVKFDRLKKSTNEDKRQLESERQRLDDEIAAFNAQKNAMLGLNAVTGSQLTLGGKNKKK